ncbi:hypothetical protein J6590_041130 [Homalodisca vitripennis]|nr:hypothetical protein J6590_041130 [Homalodisca vitripennis]
MFGLIAIARLSIPNHSCRLAGVGLFHSGFVTLDVCDGQRVQLKNGLFLHILGNDLAAISVGKNPFGHRRLVPVGDRKRAIQLPWREGSADTTAHRDCVLGAVLRLTGLTVTFGYSRGERNASSKVSTTIPGLPNPKHFSREELPTLTPASHVGNAEEIVNPFERRFRVSISPVNTNRTASLGETPPSSVTTESAASGLPQERASAKHCSD